MTDRDEEKRASRVAMAGITTCLVCTSLGMALQSPALGGIGLLAITVLVLLRHPIARALPRR